LRYHSGAREILQEDKATAILPEGGRPSGATIVCGIPVTVPNSVVGDFGHNLLGFE
jgi:hypothetical protein